MGGSSARLELAVAALAAADGFCDSMAGSLSTFGGGVRRVGAKHTTGDNGVMRGKVGKRQAVAGRQCLR